MNVFVSRDILLHEHVFPYRTSGHAQYKHPTPVNMPSLWSDTHYAADEIYPTEQAAAGEVREIV